MIMTKKTATTKRKSSWTMKTSGKCAATMWTGVVKLCIKGLNDSLSNVMKSDIMSLLDHVAFEIKTINEK